MENGIDNSSEGMLFSSLVWKDTIVFMQIFAHIQRQFLNVKPYGQAGQLPGGRHHIIDWVRSSNFISWLLYNKC